MKKLFLLICFIAMLLPGMLLAENGYDGHWGFKNPEVKKYVSQNIMPILYEKRQILENELTPSEKTEIAECRTSLKLLQAQEHKLRKEIHEEKADGNFTENTHEVFADLHKQRNEIMQRINKVADMHSTTLSGIRAQLEPQHQQWKKDIDQIRSANTKKQTYDQPHGEIPLFSLSGHHAATFFILLEPQTAQSRSDELKYEGFTTDQIPVSLFSFAVWPNPASNEIVTGNDPLPTTNELTLFDVQGQKVMTIENVQSAQHVNISTLPAGSYIVRLTSGDQTASRQMVITH